ncbi:hypothetical protein Pcinc_020884 [Petrolisthes cinctipes]|uniref:Diaminopimelate decarboxylase n=1 Tax=Petrolisthes cinctipes TaxID=88211 RepID=A0AAE1FHG7_PETCI|nr:hypothetical protein Pcinc_020884 [Petrolisthes cinctipes]
MPLEILREDLRQEFGHGSSPAFVYSHSTLVANTRSYTSALDTLGSRGVLSYSLKANSNPALLKVLREAGVSMATCVSGNEILMALRVGFPAHQIILNGNGKRRWEVELAVKKGSLLNVDSLFDAHQIIQVARTYVGKKKARVLLRLNPAIDAHTHPYLATALTHSKFGVEKSQVEQVLQVLYEARDSVSVEGVHIHIGSAVTRITLYTKLMTAALTTLDQIRKSGWTAASTINLGGGLDVSYIPPASNFHTTPTADSPSTSSSNFDTTSSADSSSNKADTTQSPDSSTSVLITTHIPDYPPRNVNTSQNGVVTSTKTARDNTPTTSSSSSSEKLVYTANGVPPPPQSPLASPGELVNSLLPLLPSDVVLIMEPGRSIVATAGVVVTEVLGVKSSGGKQFVVVDAAMTELIRPALYGARHVITPITTQVRGATEEKNTAAGITEESGRGGVVETSAGNGVMEKEESAGDVAGKSSAGVTEESAAGVTGKFSAGNTGKFSAGDTGKFSAGVTEELAAGVTEESAAGVMGKFSADVTGKSSAGVTGGVAECVMEEESAGGVMKESPAAEGVEVDVVGPVCECSDVLSRGCVLPSLPSPGAALVVWTAGAYCSTMASHYNLRPHAPEVLVSGTGRYKVIRRPQQFEEVIGNCVWE